MALLQKRGFQFAETMAGTFATVTNPEENRRFSFSVELVADSVVSHLRDGKMRLKGTLEADGFAECVPIEGTLTLLPFTRRVIRYEFHFTADDGNPHRFMGQKEIEFGRGLFKSFTVLPGVVYDAEDREIAHCSTRFDARADLFQFVSSWRPA